MWLKGFDVLIMWLFSSSRMEVCRLNVTETLFPCLHVSSRDVRRHMTRENGPLCFLKVIKVKIVATNSYQLTRTKLELKLLSVTLFNVNTCKYHLFVIETQLLSLLVIHISYLYLLMFSQLHWWSGSTDDLPSHPTDGGAPPRPSLLLVTNGRGEV